MNDLLRKHKKIVVWIVVVTFIIGGALFGYGVYSSTPKGNQSSADAIAMVNKESIPTKAYYDRLQGMADQLSSLPPQQVLSYRYQILDSMIQTSLLLQEVKKERIKVKVVDKDVDEYVEKIKKDNQITQEQLVEAVKSNFNMDLNTWKKEIKKSLVDQKSIEALLKKVITDIKVTDEDIKKDYEKVDLSNIFVAKGKDAAKSKAKAEEALAQIKAGTDFKKVAEKYSENSDASHGGYVGTVTRSYWGNDKDLADKAFALEKGQVSDVIETSTGYHILKIDNKVLAEGKTFESEKAKLKEESLKIKQSQAQNEWFEKLRSRSKITINSPELAGYQAMSRQDFKTAIEKFESAVSQNGADDVVLTYLSAAYKASGNNDKAIEVAAKAVENSPRWENYLNLGQLYQAKGDKAKAVENFKIASENAGDDYYAHYQLQSSFAQIGAADMAKAEEVKIQQIVEKLQKQAAELKAKEEADKKAAEKAKTTTDTTKTNK